MYETMKIIERPIMKQQFLALLYLPIVTACAMETGSFTTTLKKWLSSRQSENQKSESSASMEDKRSDNQESRSIRDKMTPGLKYIFKGNLHIWNKGKYELLEAIALNDVNKLSAVIDGFPVEMRYFMLNQSAACSHMRGTCGIYELDYKTYKCFCKQQGKDVYNQYFAPLQFVALVKSTGVATDAVEKLLRDNGAEATEHVFS
jgi:hypothetical protein